MSRNEIIFNLYYSHYLELMNGTLMGRVDRCISLLLMVLGGAALASFANYIAFGAGVAFISAFQFVFQPGNKSGLSIEHSKKYLQLVMLESTLADDEILHKRYLEIQSLDNLPLGLLKNAAFKRAAIKLDLDDQSPPLSKTERFVAWIAGDLPENQKNERQSLHS
ncbi:hypothetical protein [Pantoea septica]|uniref:hypothetical protein n=1 Tax=Pantoea septica TaxID=472695 RepID=UPI00206DCEFB|nr:hypothetical protein [Pantoea septica]DAI70269.1 MAG TPA: hypothetical protein [Bacteriophage sp.]